MTRRAMVFLMVVWPAFAPTVAWALITGGEGNAPLTDPGWPKGAAALFNHAGRIAWWEGPPFGGGEWHAECRGTAAMLDAVLADYARVDVRTKRIIVHDGVGQSFWLNPNNEPAKRDAARVDWTFTIWQPDRWERLRALPVDLNPTSRADTSPPSRIDVYTDRIRWSDVTVPKGITVVDERLEAHGYTAADSPVIEGKATDLATLEPLAATIRVQTIETPKSGGYRYATVAETRSDAQGRWVLKKAPVGWLRVIVETDDHVPRIAGFVRLDGLPHWQVFDCALVRAGVLSGRVIEESGHPLAGVQVQFADVEPATGGRYQSPLEFTVTTDASGRFRADRLPVGKATIWLRKSGYCRPGLGIPVLVPGSEVSLTMKKAARVRVTVDFSHAERPAAYLVKIEPEGGEAVGKWGGSATIDATNQLTFKDVPPGRYVVRGQPNPSAHDQWTEPVTLELVGGRETAITVHAK